MRRRIGALDRRHHVENGGADIGGADITRQHAIASPQHTALLDAANNFTDQASLEHLALPVAVSGVVGKLHGVDRPHFYTHALKYKYGGGIADMAIGNV